MNRSIVILVVAAACSFFTTINAVFAQGTAFTYQGQLQNNGGAISGTFNLTFSLFAANTGGSAIAGPVTTNGVVVTNGLFMVQMDFGAGPWNGQTNWLEIGVETNGDVSFTTLAPRQELTPTPYAIFANSASNLVGTLPVAQLSGTVPLAQLPTAVVTNNASGVNLIGSFSGNGTYLTNVNLQNVNSDGAITWTTNYYWGNFVWISSPAVGSAARCVVATDVNGDGHADLISANSSANTLTVLTNDGTGNFVLSATLPTGQEPYCEVAADVNGDGHIDLICANQNDNTLTVYTNNGTGGFVLASTPAAGSDPISVVAADVNGDGYIDLISGGYGDTMTVLTNNGTGGFVLASTLFIGKPVRSVTAADVNGDGHIDLISANLDGTLTVLTNNGTGGFVPASTPTVGTPPAEPYCVIAADVNGDGHIDLIDANSTDNTLTVLTNNGTGGFVLAATLPTGNFPVSVIATNVNGSGHVDLICANEADNTLSVFTNNGSGGFVLASTPPVGSSPFSVAAADVNKDGHVDLISASYNGTLSVLLNTNVAVTPYFAGNGSKLTGLNFAQFNGSLPASQLPTGVVTNNEASVNFVSLAVTNLTVAGTNEIAPLTVSPNMPTSPIASLTTGQYPLFVAVAGRYVYVANEFGNSLQIIDVSTPTNPVVVGSVGTAAQPNAVAVAGRYAYVACGGELQVFDVGNPTSPVAVGSVTGLLDPRTVAVAGRYAYLANQNGGDNGGGLQIIDVGNPANPVSIGTASTGANSSPVAATMSGRYVYLETEKLGPNALEIFDVSNPANPVMVGSLASAGNYYGGVAVSGRYVYVAGGNGLQIVDVSNPASPVQVSLIHNININDPDSIAVAGRYACVADYEGYFWIIDVSNPANPLTVGTISTGGNATSVALSGRYAYVANLVNTLQIYDLGGAYIQPLEAGSIETGTLQTRDTATIGNNLDVRGGLTVSASARISGGLAADTITATNFIGNGAGLTNLNVSQAQLPANVVTNTETGVTLSGTFSGNGSGLTGLNAANLTGSIGNGQLANSSITITPGTGLSGGTVALGGSITLNNTGVTSLTGGDGVTVSAASGDVTLGLGSTITLSGTLPAGINAQGGPFLYADMTSELFVGLGAGNAASTGLGNTAVGSAALHSNTGGQHNTGLGIFALYADQGGSENAANGAYALEDNLTGNYNMANGASALAGNTSGSGNTAGGYGSLELNQSGYYNTALGYNSLGQLGSANSMGGSNNIALGIGAGGAYTANESSNIDIGNVGVLGENQVIRIGDYQTRAYIAGVITGNGGGLTNLNLNAIPLTLTNVTNLSISGSTEIAPLTIPPNLPAPIVGSVTIGSVGASPNSIALSGRYAYVVNATNDTLQVIDVSTPTNPVVIATVSGLGAPYCVAAAGRYVYVGDQNVAALQVFDVGNPSAPVSVGTLSLGATPYSVAVAGRYVYVAASSGLRIYDVAIPSNPVLVGTATILGGPCAVQVNGRYAYVMDYVLYYMYIFDVSNPAHPVSVGSTRGSGIPYALAVSGRYAYVGNVNPSHVEIFDVSNPALPTIANYLYTSGGGNVVVAGRYVYADGAIIDVSNPANPVSYSAPNLGGAMAISGRYCYELGLTNLAVVDLGGAYIQQLEAGTIETATLQTRDTATVGNNLDVRGGLTVSASARISGGLGADSITATNFAGNAAGLTNLNATQLTGVLPLAQLPTAAVTNNNSTSVTLTGAFNGNGGGLTNLATSTGYANVYLMAPVGGNAVNLNATVPLNRLGPTNGWAFNGTSALTNANAGLYLIHFEGWTTAGSANLVQAQINGGNVSGAVTYAVTGQEFSHSFIVSLNALDVLQFVNAGPSSSMTLNTPNSGGAGQAFTVAITRIR